MNTNYIKDSNEGAITFQAVSSKIDFPAMESRILDWWNTNQILSKYLHLNQNADKRWSFIDGPITANNPMGVHHGWGRSYKDLFQRYKTMQGFQQRYQNGFDGQGLWVEVEVEKEMGFSSKRDIEEFGIDKFVEACKQRVRRYADIITEQSIRLGYWMDWSNSYHTMSDENNYTIWHFLKVCHEKGWIYEGTDVMPWCPRCATGLSEHEIVTEGYKDIVHESVYVCLPLVDKPREYILVWTTTPWTLTSNVSAAVNPKLPYVKVQQGDYIYYLAKALLSVIKGDCDVLEEIKGDQLVGLKYHGPFDDIEAQNGISHVTIPWEEVTDTEGTGIVHIAPGAGKEDFALGKEFNLPTIAPLDEFGNYINGFGSFTGRNVSEVAKDIFSDLEQKGLLFRTENYKHRYPVCWRCDSELVFRLVDEWFISMDELRGMISDVTRTIRWIPEFGMERELDWLRNMDDWMISKKRYWGLALPIYKCTCGHIDVLGSKDELMTRSIEGWDKFDGHSPHKPWIDEIKIQCAQCGLLVQRIRDVGNPWLDAGIVPFSTLNYQDNMDTWSKWFPADWISESFPGQFRNWFYSLLTMSTVLENTKPFKSVFSYALMRDEKGQEMHKSKGNSIEFIEASEKMGVDAMRWVFSRQNPAQNLNFGYRTVDEVRRRFLIPLWNVYSFFVTYANIDAFKPNQHQDRLTKSELDMWILSELNSLISTVTNDLDNYDPSNASRHLEEFVELLSNWYVRRSRRRFWKSENDEDKISAYETLYSCLVTISKLLAPIVPFISEEMYQNLVRSVDPTAEESVHFNTYPIADSGLINNTLSETTRLAMKISSLGRSARSKAGIKVRQPISKIYVKTRSDQEADLIDNISSQVLEELNIKEIVSLTREQDFMDFRVELNRATVGPKYGSEISIIETELSKMDSISVAISLMNGVAIQVGSYSLGHGEINTIVSDKPGHASANDGGYSVVIPTDISIELLNEGSARELVHIVQNMRRSANFEISDHIVILYSCENTLRAIIEQFSDYIRQETLCSIIAQSDSIRGDSTTYTEQHNIGNSSISISISKSS